MLVNDDMLRRAGVRGGDSRAARARSARVGMVAGLTLIPGGELVDGFGIELDVDARGLQPAAPPPAGERAGRLAGPQRRRRRLPPHARSTPPAASTTRCSPTARTSTSRCACGGRLAGGRRPRRPRRPPRRRVVRRRLAPCSAGSPASRAGSCCGATACCARACAARAADRGARGGLGLRPRPDAAPSEAGSPDGGPARGQRLDVPAGRGGPRISVREALRRLVSAALRRLRASWRDGAHRLATSQTLRRTQRQPREHREQARPALARVRAATIERAGHHRLVADVLDLAALVARTAAGSPCG